jgi:hypothetical protein
VKMRHGSDCMESEASRHVCAGRCRRYVVSGKSFSHLHDVIGHAAKSLDGWPRILTFDIPTALWEGVENASAW